MLAGPTPLDALIIGGGIAGLWTLNELTRRGRSALLLEHTALGSGQTIWSQGIIHGGLKYTLAGLMSPSAQAIRDMPALWRNALQGALPSGPDLSAAGGSALRAPSCYLWQTASIASRAAMIGARAGLRVAPTTLEPSERPPILRDCPGTVARLDEQVIEPARVLAALAAPHERRILRASAQHFRRTSDHWTISCTDPLAAPGAAPSLDLTARTIVLAAGAGNARLLHALQRPSIRTQIRPLRMVMLRAPALPALSGHCVDGSRTRVTITTTRDAQSRTIWQLGGNVAERGASMDRDELLAFAHAELLAVLPGIDLSACDWAVYDAPRAEPATPGLIRPDDAVARAETDGLIAAWPTKLALAPRLASLVADHVERLAPRTPALAATTVAARETAQIPDAWPRPAVAQGPWDDPQTRWTADAALSPARRAQAES